MELAIKLAAPVATGFRRQGMATALLRAALAEEPGTYFLEVRGSNHGARMLYRRAGFEPIGERQNYYADPPDDAIVMRILS